MAAINNPPALIEFKERLRELGFYRRPTARVLIGWVYNLALLLGGLWLFTYGEPLWLRIPGILISTWGLMGIATNGHTASHNAVSEKKWVNDLLFYIGFPFFVMVSARYWHYSHVRTHHSSANIIGVDHDCDLMPFFALNERELEGLGPTRRLYHRYQAFFFPILLFANGFNIQRQGFAYLFQDMRRADRLTVSHYADMAALFLHICVWIVLPMFFFAPVAVLLVYALRITLMGYAMFFAFAPAHYPAESIYLSPAARKEVDFFLHQTRSTINFKSGLLRRFALNGLEYQIEHHLFPMMCHVYYRKLSPLLKEFCEQNGYPYRTMGWARASWKSFQVLFHPKPVLDLSPVAAAAARELEPALSGIQAKA